MVDIYYPYFEHGAKWYELRYSLRSIAEHFKFDFRVWIVGDLPEWIHRPSVNHIPHCRVEGVQENTLYDAITKQLLFCNHPDTAMYFIRMYDDIYILKDLSLGEVGQYKAMFPYSEMPQREGIWWNQLSNTLDVLVKHGYPGWNTETHLPELFNKEKLRWTISAYGALENRLLLSSLYFNTFYPFTDPLMFSKDWAVQFYGETENRFYTPATGDIAQRCEGKSYLNHNNAGLTGDVQAYLCKKFPHKSPYEK